MIDNEDVERIASRVDFSRLKGARVLITGGSGFVGHWLQVAPVEVKVRALNHLQYDYSHWDRERWDYVIHLANVHPGRVMECAARSGAPVLFASSGSVLADKYLAAYTLGKIAHEEALLDSGLDVRIARMFTFAGAYLKNHFALTNMIYDALSSQEIIIRAQNQQITRSYLYAADMAVWLWRMLLDGKRGCIYQVGSSKPVSMYALAREVQRSFPGRMIQHVPQYSNDPRPYYVADPRLIEDELGVAEWTPFEEAIAKTCAHYREEMEVRL